MSSSSYQMSQKNFPHLEDEQLRKLIHEISQFGLSNGLLMYPPAPYKEYQPVLAPVTIFPTPFPKAKYEKSLEIQTVYNKLYANVVAEHKWLTSIIKQLSIHDKSFTGRLWDCYLKAQENGIVQNVSLALTRSDYMYDELADEIKQVEFNTVSVSFGGLSPKVGKVHQYLNKTGIYSKESSGTYYETDDLPISESDVGLARGLYSGVEYYNKQYLSGKNESIVLMVVQENERNAFDQRAIEYHLLNKYDVICKRVELGKVMASVKVDKNKGNKLFYEGYEVSVVYYRSAYGPDEFEDAATWDCRTCLESSLAIKCPSLLTQLSGSKKIQQLLTDKTTLQSFISESEVSQIYPTFCKIYPMDNSEEGQIARKLAFENPGNFVLKPQREGGGNNIYMEDIPSFLKSIDESEWEAYILMELIHPKTHKNTILRNGELLSGGIVSELGIFGSYLFNEQNGEIVDNQTIGHLLRSKSSSSNEGGVAAGFGCVDNMYLY